MPGNVLPMPTVPQPGGFVPPMGLQGYADHLVRPAPGGHPMSGGVQVRTTPPFPQQAQHGRFAPPGVGVSLQEQQQPGQQPPQPGAPQQPGQPQHPSHLRRNSCLALRVRTLSKLPRPLAHNLRGCVLHRAASGNSLDLFLRWVFQCQPLWRRQRPCSRVGLWEILCMLNQECRRLGLWASHLSRVVMLMPVVMFQLRHRRSRHRVSMEVA